MRTGVVTRFDAHAGWGAVRADGDRGDTAELFFHCTAIADGSRTIATGATVTFTIVAGPNGRWEANDLRPRQ